MVRRTNSDAQGCPFMEAGDSRCAGHFTLGRLNEAFDVCLNGHLGCPTYYRLLREQRRATCLTLDGQPFDHTRSLRPTGT